MGYKITDSKSISDCREEIINLVGERKFRKMFKDADEYEERMLRRIESSKEGVIS